MRKGPPKLPSVPEMRSMPNDGESEHDHKRRLIREKFMNETDLEAEMVDFFKQILVADSRGVITSFVTSIMITRDWGSDHSLYDSSLTTIAKTMRQLQAWAHPDRFATFVSRSIDHHNIVLDGFFVLTQAVLHMSTKLAHGHAIGGVVAYLPCLVEQKPRQTTTMARAPQFGPHRQRP